MPFTLQEVADALGAQVFGDASLTITAPSEPAAVIG